MLRKSTLRTSFLTVLAVAGALSFGSTRSAEFTLKEDLSLEKVVPISIERMESGSPKASKSDPWNLFDSDTQQAFTSPGGAAVRLRLTLDAPRTLHAFSAFGDMDGELSLLAEIDGSARPIPGFERLYLNGLEPVWQRFQAREQVRTRVLIVEWRPDSAGASLPEIELWTVASTPLAKRRETALRTVGVTQGDIRFLAADPPLPDDSTAPEDLSTFQFQLAAEPRTFERAFLVYDLEGDVDASAVLRSVNGLPPQGGLDAPARPADGLQVEEINPRWLRQGKNEVRVDAAGSLYLAIVTNEGRHLVTAAETTSPAPSAKAAALVDGDLMTGWDGTDDPQGRFAGTLDLPMKSVAQPHTLELNLAEGADGTLIVEAVTPEGGSVEARPPLDLSSLGSGFHRLGLYPDLPASSALRLSWQDRGPEWTALREVDVLASPVGPRTVKPRLVLSEARPMGEGSDEGAYLRGFVETADEGTVEIFVDGLHVADAVNPEDGAFGLFVPRASAEDESLPWTLRLEAVYPDGTILEKTVWLDDGKLGDGQGEGREKKGTSSDEPYQQLARPGEETVIEHEGIRLVIPPGALSEEVTITIDPLSADEVADLDTGMTNVTAPFPAFRLGPDGLRFQAPITVSLAYDPSLLPEGLGDPDIETYFFDEAGGRWMTIDRLPLKSGENLIVSRTDHFTDYINATLTLPDHPSGSHLNPNSIKDLQLADPSAGISLIAEPTGQASGDAELSFPIEVPPGRLGQTPDLSVHYTSSAGSSWLGLGWDLPAPSIVADVVFGVPRYRADLETETYLLNGHYLAPTANLVTPAPRVADRVFTLRVEGSFQRIVRWGDSPDNYWWEVTDKDGTRFIYGRSVEARLRDYQSPHNTFRWFLEQVIDPNGNSIDYTYFNDTGTNGETWTQLYLSRVDYTGTNGGGAYYSVTFHLDDGSRTDKLSSGLSGFKVYTRYRLDHVDVTAGAALVRRYQFHYRDGNFAKSLLDAIAVLGADGQSEFYRHSFDYFEMPTQDDGFDGFRSQSVWGSMGSADDYTDTTSVAGGAHGFVGVGPPGCAVHGGVQAGFEVGTTWTDVSFVDVNGDGLPDRLAEDGEVDLNYYNHSTDGGGFSSSNLSGTASPLGQGDEHSFDVGIGLHALGEAATVGVSYVWNHNSDDRLIADVNGDGFADLVSTDGGFTARINEEGQSFQAPASWGGFTLDGVDLSIPEQEEDLSNDFRLANTLRKLVLPYSGTVVISGAVQKLQATGSDGVEVSIYRNSSRVWHHDIAADDTSACTPAASNACGSGLTLNVTAGQRLYFMASAVDETSGDDLLWEPRVAYTYHDGHTLSDTERGAQEPYGADVYTFDGSGDFRLAGPPGGGWTANANGTVLVYGSLVKEATADDVTARVTKNGSTVYSRSLSAAEVVTLDEVPAVDVDAGDVLEFLLESDAQVDPDRVTWTPSVTYEGGTFCRGVPGEDSEVCGAVSCAPDPETGSVTCTMPSDPAPEVPIEEEEVTRAAQVLTDVHRLLPSDTATRYWEAPSTDDFSFRVNWSSPLLRTHPAYVYMQGVHLLWAKRTVAADSSGTSFTQTVSLSQGDRVYFTSIAEELGEVGTFSACLIGEDDEGNETCTAVTVNSRYRDDDDDALSGGYHGWFYGEWNGNASFNESGFDVNEDDESADFAAATPNWEGTDEVVAPAWTASGFDLYLTADGGKPSRLGANVSEELDSLSGGSGPSMLRKGYGHTIGVDASLGVNLSFSRGYSVSQIDFLDMNADQYPDQVTEGEVRFSNGVNAFGPQESISGLSSFRRAEDGNYSQSVGLGISFTKKKGDGKPKEVASTMPSIGSATAISQDRVDLIDVNGDGLPDRVSMDPGSSTMDVRLNLGYRFGDTESWPLPSWADGASDRCREAVDFVGSDIIDLIGNLDNPNALALSSNASLSAGLGVSGSAIGGGAGIATTLARSIVELTDVNGDSLPDHVYKDDDEDFFRVKINEGDRWGEEEHWYVPSWSTSLGDGYGGDLFQCFDAVSFSGQVTGNGSFNASVCIPLVPPVVVAGLQLEFTAQANGGSGGVQLFLEDIDGDGLADHILKKAGDPNVYVKRNNAGKVNLLRSVSRPLGGSFTLDYRRQGNRVDYSDESHRIDRGENQWVLATTALADGRGNTYTTSFDYFNDAFFDRVERQEYGFARVLETRPDGSTVDTRYHNQDFYRRNLAFSIVTRDAAGRLFKRETRQYENRQVASNSFFPALLAEATFFYEGTTSDEGAFQKSTLDTFEYDTLGNVIRFTDFVDEGPEDDAIATIAYHIDPSTHIMKPSRIEVRNADGRLLRGRSAAYDGAGRLLNLEETLIGGRNPATGSTYSGSDNAVWNLAYDALGNLTSISDPEGFSSYFSYDAATQTHVTQITDSFGYTSGATYNLAYGVLAATTDKNGNRTARTYDVFGRLTQVAGPYDIGSATPTIAMQYGHAASPAYAVTHHKDVTRSDTIDTVVFIDGLTRTIQTKRDLELDGGSGTSSSVGMQVSGRLEFDALGRVSAVGQPIFDRGSTTSFVNVAQKNPTRFTYDVLDRTTNVGFPNGGNTVMDYGFHTLDDVRRLTRSRTDAEGRTTRTYLDVTDVVVAVEQSNLIGGTRRQLITRYGYNAMVELVSVTDPGGNETEVEYDTLGRRTVIDSPDAGRTEMRYDRAGNLGAKITANLAAAGQQIRYFHTFNRLDRIDYPDMPDVYLSYGAPGAGGNRADRIATITDESGIEERSYGRLGEIVSTTKTATALNGYSPKGPYTTTFEYDSFNRLLRMVYPDGEELTYTYDAGGKLQGAAGVLRGTRYSYIEHLGYDEFGQRARILYGNGVESRYTYTPEMRRLAQLVTVESDGREIQDLRYDYNRVGTILGARNDVPVPRPSELGGPSQQTFRYDDLYQLVGAEGSYRFKKKESVYSLSVSYDEIGNITAKTRAHDIVNPGGKALRQKKTSFDWTYAYGGPHPHAATHLGERTFFHDLNGNQLGWDHDKNGTRRTVTWDEENRVKSVADNGRTTRFLYSATGERTNKQGPHGETIYVNQYFTVRNGAIGSKHIFADQVRVASKVAQPSLNGSPGAPGPTEDKRYFYHGDHLSSANFVTDKDGELYQHYEYFPFGEQWVTERSESQRTPYLFSGKELDEETGLYYFGARYYEPRQSQWISPDPILGAMLDNESLASPNLSSRPYRLTGHLYAYAANSPINLVDPTGLLESDSVAQRPRARSLPTSSTRRASTPPSRPRSGSAPSRVASPSTPPPVRNAAPVTRERSQSAPLPRRASSNEVAPAGRPRAQSAPPKLGERAVEAPPKNDKVTRGKEVKFGPDGATSGSAPPSHVVDVFSGAPGAILEATPLLDAREALNLEAGSAESPVRELDDGRPVYEEPRRRSPGEGSRP